MPAAPSRSIAFERSRLRIDRTMGVEMVQQTREVTRSEQYFEEAKRVLPGGVTAAARLHRGTGRPFVAARAHGSRLWDVDGKEHIDFCMSFGASLLGHGHPDVVAAVEE